MLTKMLTVIVMTGALYVAGDAVYQNLDCCSAVMDCCPPASECSDGGTKEQPSGCCVGSTGAKKTSTPDCCSEPK